MEKEIWKSVKGYEGFYEVSNLGRLKSLSRIVKTARGKGFKRNKEKIVQINQGCGPNYKQVTLSKEGIITTYALHKLVLTTFVGPRPEGMEACHFDGDAGNNKLSNLRWDTRQANRKDTERLGRTAKGEKNGNAKLSDMERREICKLKDVLPLNRIAKLYNVWQSTIIEIQKQEW